MLVFVTDDGISPEGTGPVVYLLEGPEASLPPRPRAMEWRYFATMDSSDSMFEGMRAELTASLAMGRPYVSPFLMAGRHLADYQWKPRESAT